MQLGGYDLSERIGAGGMAEVLLGRKVGPQRFGRVVAIKRIRRELAQDATSRELFLDEARLAARIRHAKVVATLDVVDCPEAPFIVMEYVDGVSLAALLKECGRAETIPLPIVSAIVVDVLDGLHAAHETRGDGGKPLAIVHRDVSPQNVLIGRDGVARVIDFGIARAAERAHHTESGVVKGKLAYMPPEQMRGRPLSASADIYAVGAVLWECLTGRRFRDGNDAEVIAQILAHDVDPPSRFAATIRSELDDVVLTALATSPEQRYTTAAEMADALIAAAPPAPARDVARFVARVAAAELAMRAALAARIADAPVPIERPMERDGPHKGGSPEREDLVTVPALAAATGAPPAQLASSTRLPALFFMGGGVALAAVAGGVIAATTLHRLPGRATSAAPPTEVASVAASSRVAVTSGGEVGSVATASPTAVPPALPSAEALPSRATKTHAPSTTKHDGLRRSAPRAPSTATKPDSCAVPYELDSEGNRRYKRECIR